MRKRPDQMHIGLGRVPYCLAGAGVLDPAGPSRSTDARRDCSHTCGAGKRGLRGRRTHCSRETGPAAFRCSGMSGQPLPWPRCISRRRLKPSGEGKRRRSSEPECNPKPGNQKRGEGPRFSVVRRVLTASGSRSVPGAMSWLAGGQLKKQKQKSTRTAQARGQVTRAKQLFGGPGPQNSNPNQHFTCCLPPLLSGPSNPVPCGTAA